MSGRKHPRTRPPRTSARRTAEPAGLKRSNPVAIRDRIQELRRVRAGDLIANPRNWRRHPESQAAALRGVLAEIGYADALLARETKHGLMLIDGHLRAELDQEQVVPVLVLDVTEAEADTLLATHDVITAMAEIDRDALATLIAQASIPTHELLSHLQSIVALDVPSRDWAERADSLPELIGKALTNLGDVWELGRHRLLCGDATDADDVARLMDGHHAQLFSTDPPYLVDYDGANRPSHGKDWSSVYHEIDIDDAPGFLRAVFSNAAAHLTIDAAWYCWHAHKRASLIEQIWAELEIINHQQLIWCKPTFTHGYSYYPWQHEPCLMGWRKGHKPSHDGDNATVPSVWHVDWAGAARIVGNEHPTQKPVELFAIPIRKHTRPGDICYEAFSGSGSQIIAAEAEGRICYAMEIEPRFCDVAVRRWESLTGTRAVRVPRRSAQRGRARQEGAR